MTLALTNVGLNEEKIATKLKTIMESAYTSTPDGQIIPDFKAMLRVIEIWIKLKKRGPDTVIAIPMIFSGMNGGL